MMDLPITKLLLFTGMLSMIGCFYDIEEELYPTLECQTTDMSYVNDIVPIIEAKCNVCHSAALNFGNVTLEGYGEIKNVVESGSLIGVIKHEQGFNPMPKNGPKLLDCEIEKIESWISDGASNN